MKRVFNSCISKLEDKCTLKISCKNSKLSSFKSGKLVKSKIFNFFGTFIIKLETWRNPRSIVICKCAYSENEQNDRFKTPPIIVIRNYWAKNVCYSRNTNWNLCWMNWLINEKNELGVKFDLQTFQNGISKYIFKLWHTVPLLFINL